jgi:hypothetical protein
MRTFKETLLQSSFQSHPEMQYPNKKNISGCKCHFMHHKRTPLSLRLKGSGCHYNRIYNNTGTK